MRKGNRLKDAIAAFRKAIRLRPDFAQYHDALGDALVRTGNDDGAIAAYRNAIELPPDYKSAQTSGHGHAHNRGPTSVARAHYNRGISYGRIGSLDKAIADINEYLRHQPTGMSAYVVRGKFYYEQKKYKLAMADIEKAMKLDPVAALPHRVRGSFYCRMKQYGEALADYKKAREMSLADHRERMENDKDTSGVRHGLAFFLLNCPDLELRDTALALALAKEAVEADPKEGGNWSVLGQAHYRGENYQAAVDSLAKSIDLDYERKARIWFFLAMAHSKLGHKGQAHEDYQQAAAWMRKSQPPYAALPQSQFRAEAAKVLGIEEQ
jgi:tetratricopeptide (TPR) repeat protein